MSGNNNELEIYLKLAVAEIGPHTFSKRLKDFGLDQYSEFHEFVPNSEFSRPASATSKTNIFFNEQISILVQRLVAKIKRETYLYHERFKIFLGHDKRLRFILPKWRAMRKFQYMVN